MALKGTETLQVNDAGSIQTITLADIPATMAAGQLRSIGALTGGTQTINFAGAANSAATSFAHVVLFLTGNVDVGTGGISPLKFIISDGADVISTLGQLEGMSIIHAVGSGASGGRTALQSTLAVTANVASSPTGDHHEMSAFNAIFYSTSNQGADGTGAVIDDQYRGEARAANSNARLESGATFYRGLFSHEFTVALKAGASAFAKCNLLLVAAPNDAVQAVEDDAAIIIGAGDGRSVFWKTGIQFGASWGPRPFDASSKLIWARDRLYPSAAPMTAGWGIHFSDIDFATAAIVTPGFTVDPDGDVTAKSFTTAAGRLLGASAVEWLAGKIFSTFPQANTTAAIGAVDLIYFYPFPVDKTLTVVSGFGRTVTGGAGSSIKCGIWANLATTNRPSGAPVLVDNTGVATTGSAANVTPALAGSLPPGKYWMGVKATGTLPTMVVIPSTSEYLSATMGLTTVLHASCLTFADAYANSMPTLATNASFTEAAAVAPIIGLQL